MLINRTLLAGAVAATLCLFAACDKEKATPEGPIICYFGDPGKYLMITTESAMQVGSSPVYLITEGGSYINTKVSATLNIDSLGFQQMSAEKHQRLAPFLPDLPDSLKISTQHTFGCLSCADEPVYILAYKEPGKDLQIWKIDSYSIPSYMKDYLERLLPVLFSMN